MSSEIGLNDVKPGMWVEFDDADGHYAGELHEMKNPESMVDVLIMSMGHKPPLYIETEDEGNLVVFLDFGDGYTTGSVVRNVHVYESKPETESVKQAEDDDKKPFWKGKTCKELDGLHVKITWNNGDTMTSTLNIFGNAGQCELSPARHPAATFAPYADIKSIELVDDAPRTDDAPRVCITDITKVRPGDKVVVKNGNEYTVKKTDSDRMGGQTLCLSIEELGFPDGWWMDDSFFQYAYRGPYTMADLPEEPGFYKARTESVWKHDGKRWMPVLAHDGTIAPAFPCQSQSRSQFFKTSVRDGRFLFTKVEASFE